MKPIVINLAGDGRQFHSRYFLAQLAVWPKNPISLRCNWIKVQFEHFVLDHHGVS